MSSLVPRVLRAAVVLLPFALLSACGTSTLTLSDDQLAGNAPFVKVSRGALSNTLPDGGAGAVGTNDNEHFYLAINKSQLTERWFLSAFLTQWHPSENIPMRSLGTKVVTFKVQNGKLFVFDATDGKTWSDALNPDVVIEAWPVVTDYAPFNALANSSNYVLVDPAAGLNKFSFVSDELSNYYVHFNVDLTYLQRYRELNDGISFEEVFTGTSDYPAPGYFAYEQPFRGSGTLAMSLRRYRETPGFTPTPWVGYPAHYFGSDNFQYVKDHPAYQRATMKWAVSPGMQPIEWRISDDVATLEADPRLAGVDVRGAIARGVTGWNQAFGFEALRVVPTQPGDSAGDDDKNFIVVDVNPGAGYAFANMRENPNTGELRGASVYFSSAFIEGALQTAPDAGPIDTDAGTGGGGGTADAGTGGGGGGGGAPVPCAPDVVISQVFGGNSATGAYNQDFVELHNRTDMPVALAGLSLQYASATGSNWNVLTLGGTIAPDGYFLVGLASSTGGTALPTPDWTGGLNMSNSSGKVALVSGVAALSGACPVGDLTVLDFVGYGAATCSQGAGAAPALNGTLAGYRNDNGCADTFDNAADFSANSPSPRNSSAGPIACTCSAGSTTAPQVGVDGGAQLVPPNHRSAGHLSWDSMTPADVCAMPTSISAAIPAGMTRKEYIEAYITHTILHEVGHTLGLRHNFKGSLANDSVMDYLVDDDSIARATPGAYDVAAVQYLYGLSAAAPTQSFCTDEQTVTDAECDRFDTTASPLDQDVAPHFTTGVRNFLAGTGGLTYGQIWSISRYVRAPKDEAQRLQAFNLMFSEVAPPLRSDVIALSSTAPQAADLVAAVLLQNLFLDPSGYRDETQVTPSVYDTTFRTRVIAVAKDILTNSDQHRSFESRRLMVDVLKSMQTYDAYQALLAAKPALQTERAGYNALGQALIDDLTKRIDVACSPYFD